MCGDVPSDVDEYNYVTITNNQRPDNPVTSPVSRSPSSPVNASVTSPVTRSLSSPTTNSVTDSLTSSVTDSLTNSMKKMQTNGGYLEDGSLSDLADQLVVNLAPEQQAMLVHMLQQTQPLKQQTDDEIAAAWEVPGEAKTEGHPSSPTFVYEETDPSTLRGNLRKSGAASLCVFLNGALGPCFATCFFSSLSLAVLQATGSWEGPGTEAS